MFRPMKSSYKYRFAIYISITELDLIPQKHSILSVVDTQV